MEDSRVGWKAADSKVNVKGNQVNLGFILLLKPVPFIPDETKESHPW